MMERRIENGYRFDNGKQQGPRMIIDHNLSSHRLADEAEKEELVPLKGHPSATRELLLSNGGKRTIRFQVVVWHVGSVDMMHDNVTMKFRVTIFWNDDSDQREEDTEASIMTIEKRTESNWIMKGRHRAHEQTRDEFGGSRSVDVPAVAIINAVSHDIIGEPEVTLLRESSRLMRWTCLYKATLLQEDMRIDKFPHDRHDLCLKLGILANRRKGSRWDRSKWKLGLATEDDSQRTTRVPYGLLVDHVKIPNFTYDETVGLVFHFTPLSYGTGEKKDEDDQCLEVKVHAYRESNYYDSNIMPLLLILDLVATSSLLLDAVDFFQRGLMLLNIAFVEIGIRMTVDAHLPSVGYQIKMQSILNAFFFRLLVLTLESSLVYYLVHLNGWKHSLVEKIDLIAAGLSLVHTCVTITVYYRDRH